MNNRRFFRFLKFAPLGLLLLAVFGWVVMALWNGLVPEIFRLPAIGYWQAWGLLILGKILFGGFRGGGGHGGHWRHRMMERWEKMTPEEREKFRQELDRRCGSTPRPDAAPGA